MSVRLKLGFVPLNDAAPLIVAAEMGLFAAEGLAVELSREVSWATIRDKLSVGALDGAHVLAPVTLAATLGAWGEPQPMIAPLALNLNGAAVTISTGLAAEVRAAGGGLDARPLAQAIAARRAAGRPPMTFAVVFPYSMHNYLLRYWLAEGGIDPDRDVRLTVAPPSRMVDQLAAGEIDGFCVGEPWNAVAVRQGVGEVVTRAAQIWRAGPEKVFGVSEAWAEANPETLQALLRALLRGAAWADAPQNRVALVDLLSRADYVGADAATIAVSLGDIVFQRDGAAAPQPMHAAWIVSQMLRWGQLGPDADIPAAVARVYRSDLYDQAARALDLPAAAALQNGGGFFDGRVFQPAEASAYAASLPLSRLMIPST